MSPSFRHVTFLCLLLVQFAVHHALPTTSVPDTLISGEGSTPEGLQTEIFDLKGDKYTAVPLNDQGLYSRAYKLEEPFKYSEEEHIPAILKRVSETMSEEDSEDSKTLQEIRFLQMQSVGLYLFHQWSPSKNKEGFYDVDIVVEDISEIDPPFKPMYSWYMEDDSIIARDALSYARGHIQETLLWYAKKVHVLYRDHTLWNIYLRKTALVQMSEAEHDQYPIKGTAMPLDWGPEAEYSGVVDVANTGDTQMEIKRYSDTLSSSLKDDFNVEKLAYQLWRHGGDLREKDYFYKTYKSKEYPDGVYCRHLHIKTTEPDEDSQHEIYKVVDGMVHDGSGNPIKNYEGYLGKSAILRIGIIGRESEEIISNLREEKLHVQEDREDNLVYILYKDSRELPEGPKEGMGTR